MFIWLECCAFVLVCVGGVCCGCFVVVLGSVFKDLICACLVWLAVASGSFYSYFGGVDLMVSGSGAWWGSSVGDAACGVGRVSSDAAEGCCVWESAAGTELPLV